jgi:Na+/H+-translocating membrane pyrophosphatase
MKPSRPIFEYFKHFCLAFLYANGIIALSTLIKIPILNAGLSIVAAFVGVFIYRQISISEDQNAEVMKVLESIELETKVICKPIGAIREKS